VVEFRHLYEEERAIAEAEGRSRGREDAEENDRRRGRRRRGVLERQAGDGQVLDDGAEVDGERSSRSAHRRTYEAGSGDGELRGREDEEGRRGRGGGRDRREPAASGLERLFARLIQLPRIESRLLVLDDLAASSGPTIDQRATYAIYDPGTACRRSWRSTGRRKS
jgi:hypothetical protein